MTFHNPNKKTEFAGVRYVQGVVQNSHSIFHQFGQENDQGNDCYIEFVVESEATNYGFFAQIKSGISYKDGKGYKIPANKPHLEYWNESLYQTIGIVYDPEINKAFWVDISVYIKQHPHVLSLNHHNVRVEPENEFSEETFPGLVNYCFQYREGFKSYENFGRSLDWFACLDTPDTCYEGLKSLYSNHRDKQSTWRYIISNFAHIKEESIRRNILGLLSNYTNNPHVFWHSDNMQYYPKKEVQENISQLMTGYFRFKELKLVLPYLKDGINRGSFSFLVFLVIDLVKDLHILLKEISFEEDLENEERNFCFWLYMHVAKYQSAEETLKTAEQYLKAFPFGYEDEAIIGVGESIENGELIPVG